MLKTLWTKRNLALRPFYKRDEISKIVLKSLLANSSFPFTYRIYFQKAFGKFTFKSSISFYRYSCLFTGSSKSVQHLFRMSRLQIKEKASFGLTCGVRKSSF